MCSIHNTVGDHDSWQCPMCYAHAWEPWPTQFTDDCNGAALDSLDYYGPSLDALLGGSGSRWEGKGAHRALARAAWESGWDAAIADVRRRAEVKR